MQTKRNEQNSKTGLWVAGGLLLVGLTGGFALPVIIIGYLVYRFAILPNKEKGKTPLSSAQKAENRPQPQRPTPSQGQKNVVFDRQRFVRVTTDYGARHRENAKRLLDAGLIERDEYNQQIARSHSL